MYMLTYKNDGTIVGVGNINPDYAIQPPPEGVLYMADIPDGRPFLRTYKVQNGQLVYAPTPAEQEDAE